MSSLERSSWSPKGRPTKLDVAVAAMALVWAGLNVVSSDPLAWGWGAVGFVAFALAMGPVAASGLGEEVGTWFREIGYAGRAVVIVGFAVVVWGAYAVFSFPETPPRSVATGGFFAVAAVVGIEWIRSR